MSTETPPPPTAPHETDAPRVSVVIPLKDEEANVRPLLEELVGALEPLGPFEVLVVDDGSTDGTWRALETEKQRTPSLRPIRLDRNYGQSTAFWAGLSRARGDIVVMMDGDRQNDPADIPKLLAELEKGADVCLTWRAERQDSRMKRIQSRIGNGFRNRLLRSNIRDTGSQLRAFRARCLKDLPRFDGMHRFMGNLFLMMGHTIVQVPTHHRSRPAGVTKYGLGNRAWRGLKDVLAVRWLMQRRIRYGVAEEN